MCKVSIEIQIGNKDGGTGKRRKEQKVSAIYKNASRQTTREKGEEEIHAHLDIGQVCEICSTQMIESLNCCVL